MNYSDMPPLPTFLIIGAQKGGTRWLIKNLQPHPDVFAAETELSFFGSNEDFDKGLDVYRAKFEGWSGEPVVGESTPGYMMWRQDEGLQRKIAARIDDSLPGVKLIALLRNPVDRTYSAFLHHMRKHRISTDENLLERIRSVDPKEDRLSLISGGWYAESLTPYFERFGERLKLFLQDDIAAEPERIYSQVLEHIDASKEFLPEGIQQVRHRGIPPKTSQYVDGKTKRTLTLEERAEIYEYFRDSMERLEQLIDRDLSAWRP